MDTTPLSDTVVARWFMATQASPLHMPEKTEQHMQCMEVWGGSSQTNNGVSMLGLDAWVYSRPYKKAEAGGDVYYVSSCATGRITRLLVADVSGHGADVSQTALALRAMMRRFVNYIDQTRFVRSMNDEFVSLSQNGSFATAIVTTYFAPYSFAQRAASPTM